jgi:hypothetical protein
LVPFARLGKVIASINVVIAGLDPAIHAATIAPSAPVTEWMPGSSPGMTAIIEASGRRGISPA